ncbi:MAG: nitrate reductase cytochrome c-type subunit [Thalassobaculum sp.]|uniref:nitrate reductase cytochrome c-type subunit n=1 Tax=Thalassobaculum sp. TaxID=2022740 RepID=UPI0032ECFF57
MTRTSAFAALLPVAVAIVLAAVAGGAVLAQSTTPSIATLRGAAALDANGEPPRIPQTEETDRRRPRAYPEQPPTIPHRIDGYQLDKNGNQCLSCHARARVAESGAPMISVTHFMDRDGQFLATVSPRRYFCNQCHVVQGRVPPAVDNNFVDIDSLLAVESGRGRQ